VPISEKDCEALDASDPLAARRDLFALPDGVVYLDGNSLGALPRSVPERVNAFINDEWGRDLITSWNAHGWFDSPHRVGAKLAPLLGAAPDQVLVCDNLSLNIFKILSGAVALRPDRSVIVTELGNFPTDLYMADSVAAVHGLEVRTVDAGSVLDAIDDDVAVVSLSHVDFRTGEVLDLPAITRAAHEAGALAMWDLAHSTGVMAADLDLNDVDFAVGCGYKYLCGGPGAPAFQYVNRRLHAEFRHPLEGWHGHADPFALTRGFEPGPGMTRLRTGTPAMLSMVAFEEALEVFAGVDLAQIRTKSMALTQLFIDLVGERLADEPFELVAPADASRRGSQVSFAHPDAYPIVQALIARGVIGDFREPDRLRVGFAPLYVRYVDVWRAVATLCSVISTRQWDQPHFHERSTVT